MRTIHLLFISANYGMYVTHVYDNRTIGFFFYADCVFAWRTRTTSQIFSSVSDISEWNIQDIVDAYDSSSDTPKQYTCPFCKKTFAPKNQLKKHLQFGCKMNPRGTQFACAFCPYKSMYKANMERHVRNLHSTDTVQFHCELCDFHSNYSFCVRRHMKTFHRANFDETTKQ
ncbi:MDS1 and EVI1 complex locus protein EVI1-like [Pseudomyrmex gracilis]|uniref:MDS1 and EVI1 complex locus protein EVI1-like n=1 Tax=Pseudomyrmex gracilis TaxID=219809 RepID=UPI0009959236|nr:MDS1 and EVI1 complex locus protein EVI1-like [Pseudomyrmex gracilis]